MPVACFPAVGESHSSYPNRYDYVRSGCCFFILLFPLERVVLGLENVVSFSKIIIFLH